MKTTPHRLLTLLLLTVAMVPYCLCAQKLYNNDTTYFCTTSWQGGSLFHNYRNQGGTSAAFDSWAIITGVDSTFSVYLTFTNTNYASLVPINGFFDVWDGDPENGTLLIHHTGLQFNNQSFPITGDQITLHLHFNAHSTDTSALIYSQQFQMRWNSSNYSYSMPNPCGIDFSASIDSITSTEAILHYQPAGIPVIVTVDGQDYYTSGGTFRIHGLAPNTYHRVDAIPNLSATAPCCLQTLEFYTDPVSHLGCPNALDLHSDYVRCVHDGEIGVMDAGSDSPFSQHTIHTDTNELDQTTDNFLHTVGPGLPGSVRLGNWLGGFGSESITYYLHVDTTLYSLILLHYAAALQDPDHSPSQQPRFTMRILDENDSVIDPQCGAANFIANASLGWDLHGSALCKDWTTVAISLNAYHGQDVRLQFATRDCGQGEHFGYAYFYVECYQPFLATDHCGTIDTNTLTAPDGFNYLWYYDSPSNPIATTQSVTYSTSGGTIHCRLSFIENPSCYVTMNTYVSTFWPYAAIDTLYTVDNGCEGYEVHFRNRSTVLGEDSIPQPGSPPCETALWVFGDGYISAQYNPIHTYQHPGTYPVTLISSIAGGECRDTAHYVLVAPDAWAPAHQNLACCDSLLWRDSLWYSNDTVGPTFRVAYPETCDTVYTLYLTILPSSHHQLPADTICYNSGYFWRGHNISVSHALTDTLFYLLTDTLVAANRCDSIDYLSLMQLPVDPLNIEVEPDCGLGLYLLTAATENPFWHWSSTPHDPSLEGHESDRQLWIAPETSTIYNLTSYYGDSLFCPTTTAKRLSPPTFPRAELEVNPAVLTYDKHTLYAYDKGYKYNERQWIIVNHGTSHDTILLPDTLQRITYPVAINDYDSVTVILAVSNAFCHDTASQTLPIIRSALFAPNVFIPDAERNNRFTIVCNGAIEAELTIYNRQGLFVFSTTDLAQGWDGTHDGQPCKQDAYVWHLRYRTLDRPEQWNVQMGTVTLLR